MRTKSFCIPGAILVFRTMMRERILTLVAFNVRVEDHAMAALATLNMNLKLLVVLPQPVNNVPIVPPFHLHLLF